jgi:hypothetical protein
MRGATVPQAVQAALQHTSLLRQEVVKLNALEDEEQRHAFSECIQYAFKLVTMLQFEQHVRVFLPPQLTMY